MIDLDLLLEKLNLYGFHEDTIAWFSSYLKDRYQCVQVESAFSPFLPIHWGVPQGSILGPLIFLIFINELPVLMEKPDANEDDTISDSTLVVFADDNTPIRCEKDPEVLKNLLQIDADNITKWFGRNRMIVSGDKTKLIVVGTAPNRLNKIGDDKVELNVDGNTVKETESEKLLGIVVNHSATWKNHLHGDEENPGLLKELSKRIGILKRLRKFVSIPKFKMIVNGIWNSKLLYGLTAWGSVWGPDGKLMNLDQNSINLKKKDMMKLQVLQNSTLRLTLKRKYGTPTSTLLSEANVLSVNQLVAYNMVVQVYKVQKSRQPAYHYHRLFGNLEENQPAGTRSISRKNLRVDFKLSQSRCSFFNTSSNLWNSITPAMRNLPTLGAFKKKVRQWVKTNIPAKTSPN